MVVISLMNNAHFFFEELIMARDHPQRITLEDYSSPIILQYFTRIVRPEVQTANFSYPYYLIQLIQGNLFYDLPSEDPYAHLTTYIDIFKYSDLFLLFLWFFFPSRVFHIKSVCSFFFPYLCCTLFLLNKLREEGRENLLNRKADFIDYQS